jgi:hypothetical protein
MAKFVWVNGKPGAVSYLVTASELDGDEYADESSHTLNLHQDVVAPSTCCPLRLRNCQYGFRNPEAEVPVVLIERPATTRTKRHGHIISVLVYIGQGTLSRSAFAVQVCSYQCSSVSIRGLTESLSVPLMHQTSVIKIHGTRMLA